MSNITASSAPETLNFYRIIESLRIQKRVINALILREIITRYGRHNIGFMWLFAEPMLFTLGVTYIFSLIKGHHDFTKGISVMGVMLTGYSCLLLWRNMPNRCLEAVKANSGLLFHRNVKPIDIYLSRLIIEFSGATISLTVLTIVFYMFGKISLPKDMSLVVLGWLLQAWYGFSMAIFMGCLSERFEIIERIAHIIQYLQIPLSGTFFVVSMVPESFQKILVWVPNINCVEILRHGFFGDVIPWIYSVNYILIVNIVLTFLSALLLQSVKKYVFVN